MKHLQKNTMQRPDQNACNMSREELLVATSYCNGRNKKAMQGATSEKKKLMQHLI